MATARISSWIIVLVLFFTVFVSPALADEAQPAPEWRGGPHIGYSPYTGVIGVEVQKGHFGATLGVPVSLGLRYYLDEQGYRWFVGFHGRHDAYDEDETIDGIPYEDVTFTDAGIGFGYKWRWRNHWDLTANFSVGYGREKRTGMYATRTEEYIGLFPGLSLGYTF